MDTLKTYSLLVCIVSALCVIGPWLDGQPSDTEAERDTQAEVHDARKRARQQQHVARAEKAMQREERARVQLAAMGAQP